MIIIDAEDDDNTLIEDLPSEELAEERPVRPLRALAGATMAVAGVALGIAALLSVTDAPPDPLVTPSLAEPGLQPAAEDDEAAGVTGDAAPGDPFEETRAADSAANSARGAAGLGGSAEEAAATTDTASGGLQTESGTATAPTSPSASAAEPDKAAPAPESEPSPEAKPTQAPPPPRPAVTVLNNSRITGLAARAAAEFQQADWPVRQTGNFTGRIRATTVYYEPGQETAAERFAATFPGVARVLPKPDYIPGPPGLTVVLTRHFSS